MVANRTVLHKVECSWDDVLSGNFPTTPRMVFMQALDEVAQKARQALPDAGTRIDSAVELVRDGAIEPQDDGSYVVRNGKGKQYHVNGSCPCPDAQHRTDWCKHRIAVGLWKRTSTLVKPRLEAQLDGKAHQTHQIDSGATISPSPHHTMPL